MTSEIKPEDVKLPEPAIKMTPAGMRDFIGANFDSLEYGREDQQPDEGDRFLLSSHDLLSAFSWWDYPVFTADQVRAAVLAEREEWTNFCAKMIREATASERERCARLCWDRSDDGDGSEWDSSAIACAERIRAGHSVTETKRD